MGRPLIAQVSVAIPTTTGNQDITIAGFGTPKAAIVILSGAVSADTARANGLLSIGYADSAGTAYVAGNCAQDAQATAATGRTNYNGSLVSFPNFSGSARTNEVATFVSWITDGIRINWATAPAAAYLMTVIFFGGDGTISSKVGSVDLGTGTAAINTTLGFTPSLIFPLGIGVAADLVTGNLVVSMGAWTPSSGQGSITAVNIDAAATKDLQGYASSSAAFAQVFSAGLQYVVTLGTYASGFSATPSANSSSDVMGYLALEFDAGTGVNVSVETLPTATGSFSKTGLSFRPGFLLEASAKISAAIGTVDNADSEGFTVTGICRSRTGGDSVLAAALGGDDGAATSDESSWYGYDANIEYTGVGGGSRATYASFTSFNADGWTKNLTATDAVAYKYLSVAIEANKPIPVFMNHRMQQGMS
jgi:hypothetical protein